VSKSFDIPIGVAEEYKEDLNLIEKNRACECCLRKDVEIAGVASSGIGPMSILWCKECLANGAEPIYLVEAIFDPPQGVSPEFMEGVKVYKDGKYITAGEYFKNK